MRCAVKKYEIVMTGSPVDFRKARIAPIDNYVWGGEYRPEAYASEELGTAYKSAALRWVKRQPRMKTCRLEDITAMRRIRRVSHDGKYERYFEIEARGQKFTLGR